MATSGEKEPIPDPQGINILDGFSSVAATQAATTFLTIPAGREWQGVVSLNCAVGVAAATAAAGQATGIVSTAGAGVIPAAGSILRCDALAGANAAGGTVGSNDSTYVSTPLTVVAPAANAVQLQLATTVAGTAGVVNVTAVGALQ